MDPLIGVRIPAPEPVKAAHLPSALLFASAASIGGCGDGLVSKPGSVTFTEVGPTNSLLHADYQEASQVEEFAELVVELGLSGNTQSEPNATPTGSMTTLAANVAGFFSPAGCVTTTIVDNVATHVFADCRAEGLTVRGTVTSTYVTTGDSITISHEPRDFSIHGCKVVGVLTVVYEPNATSGLLKRKRTADWSGTTQHTGRAMQSTSTYTETWDEGTRMTTREGSATVTVAGLPYTLTVEGYRRPGPQDVCAVAGTITLERTKDGETLTLVIEHVGEKDYVVTAPDGSTSTRDQLCTLP